MQLREARILLTGASGGIGQLLVERLCAQGAQLLLVGRGSIALETLARRYPAQISLVTADLSQRNGRQLVLDAARRFGGSRLTWPAAAEEEEARGDAGGEGGGGGGESALGRSLGLSHTSLVSILPAEAEAAREVAKAGLDLCWPFSAAAYPFFLLAADC